jgi:hypothetical protein
MRHGWAIIVLPARLRHTGMLLTRHSLRLQTGE